MNHHYLHSNSNKTNKKTEIAELPTPPTPPLYFDLKQKEAWLWFWKRGMPLKERFTQHELQSQFRRLARVLHPDQNNHPKASESFIQLREHYQILVKLSSLASFITQ
jgi:hypothetical protein